jgi:hypothetical protein
MNAPNTSSSSSLDPSPYNFHQLDVLKQQIRLVKIQREGIGPIRCDICTYATGGITSYPRYSALSYTWGPATPLFHIFVGDDQTLQVRDNFYRFLLQYREQNFPQDVVAAIVEDYLWIDQICIDQSSVLEQNDQVGIMSTIYRQASSVVIRLRDDTQNLKEAA